jgi:hypothetical protein
MQPRAEVTGRKPRVSADRAKRSAGPPVADPKEIEPTPHNESKAAAPARTPPIRGPPIPLAFDIPEFCKAYRISLRFYFKLRDAGKGPREMRLGRRVLITIESAMAWARAREHEHAERF